MGFSKFLTLIYAYDEIKPKYVFWFVPKRFESDEGKYENQMGFRWGVGAWGGKFLCVRSVKTSILLWICLWSTSKFPFSCRFWPIYKWGAILPRTPHHAHPMPPHPHPKEGYIASIFCLSQILVFFLMFFNFYLIV